MNFNKQKKFFTSIKKRGLYKNPLALFGAIYIYKKDKNKRKEIKVNQIRHKLDSVTQEDPYLNLYHDKPTLEIRMVLWAQKMVKKIQSKNPLVRYSLSIFFVFLGLVGFLLPIVPGWSFIIPGVMIVSKKFAKKVELWLEKYIDWKKKVFAKKDKK